MEKSLLLRLKKLNIALVSHIFATGPALDLEEYLKDKTKSLFFIGHPFPYRKEVNSFYRIYKNKKLVKEHKAIGWKLPEVLFYVKDFLYTFWWVLSKKQKFDYYIGSDNFTAFLGLILKKIGKVNHVILYTIDYMPKRFDNPILNWLYHFFDKMCLKFCHIVWNVSPNMAKAREKYSGIKIEKSSPQIVVPLGMWHKRISRLSLKRVKYQIVFLGHILEKQGLDIAIKALPQLIKRFPQIKLLIIGTGPDEKRLRNLARKLKVENYIEFTGYVESHEEVEKLLSQSTVALATYKPDPQSFSNWADPMKIKTYIAAGLPVVLTKVPPIAKDIEKNKCGFIVDYSEKNLAKKISFLLNNENALQEYSRNAVTFAKQFDWNKVFAEALEESLERSQEQQIFKQKKYFVKDLAVYSDYNENLNDWRRSYLRKIEKDLLTNSKGKTLIDIGAGSGYISIEMARKGLKVYALDISPQSIELLKKYKKKFVLKNLHILHNPAEKIPLPSKSIDYIVANAVLEHIFDEEQAISEWNRILKIGGKIFLTVPINYKYVWPFFWPIHYLNDRRLGHLRRYNLEELKNKFKMRVQKVYYTGHFPKMIYLVLSRFAAGGIRKNLFLDKYFESIDEKNVHKTYGSSNISIIFQK